MSNSQNQSGRLTYFAESSPTSTIDEARAAALLDGMLTSLGPLRRVLLVPPDITRYHSWAGPITTLLYERLRPAAQVEVLPATGTHTPMTPAEVQRMYPRIPLDAFRAHDFRRAVESVGTVPADVLGEISGGRIALPVEVALNRLLLAGKWDRIFSIGQLVPHEVIGIANHNKNIFVGVGGADTIHKTHYLSAVIGLERIMGRAQNPVRAVLNYAERHFARELPITYVLTVRGRDATGQLVTRGLYAGDDDACFLQGAELARRVNITFVERPIRKAVVYLDPIEFKSTWLGNKAVYRTRLAIADGGDLVVLAPGVHEFGEDPEIDRLIRRHGYRGTPALLQQVAADAELAQNLSAVAHLIHGSSEGRFRITYCPGGLARDAIEGVGYQFADLAPTIVRYDPQQLSPGWNQLPDGEEIYFIANPGQGLWAHTDSFSG